MVTENGLPNAPAGDSDVDGGPTDLISPAIDLSGGDGYVSYQRWFYSNGTDVLEVAVTGDGVNWTVVETIDSVGFTNNQWKASQFRVGNHIAPTATTQVRFRVVDGGASNVVEAGIDVFSVDKLQCEFCQPTFALQTVGPATMSMCGDQLSAATPNTELRIESMPAGAGGLLLFDAFPNPSTSPWNSGQLITASPVTLGVIYANGSGEFAAPLSIGGLLPPGWALYLQAVYVDASLPGQVGITNALRVEWN